MTHEELLNLDGRKVTVKRGKRLINAEISVVNNEVYLLQNEWDGEYNIDYKGYKCASVPMYSFGNYGNGWSDIKLLDKTMKDLTLGDVIISSKGSYRRILGICGEVCFMSLYSNNRVSNDLKRFGSEMTLYELEEYGYKLAPTEEVKETLKVGELEYDKKQVEEALKNIKPIK